MTQALKKHQRACPVCGGPKDKKSKGCQSCWNAEIDKTVLEITGKQFGHLLVIGRPSQSSGKVPRHVVLVRCVCGTEKKKSTHELLRGGIRSCGCKKAQIIAEKKTTHGHSIGSSSGSATSTYISWAAARRRCSNPNDKRWHRYGGRGITFCDRWQKFENFLLDMGERPGKDYQLDRSDNNKGYSPDNCRWVRPRDNQNNKEKCRYITAFGKAMTVSEWERETGINQETIRARVDRGWSPERAMTDGATMVSDLAEVRRIISETDVNDTDAIRLALERISTLIDTRINTKLPCGRKPGWQNQHSATQLDIEDAIRAVAA